MITNLAIDPDLLEEALKIGKLPSKKATVNEALKEFIRRRRQLDAINAFGTIEFDPEYDHKQERERS